MVAEEADETDSGPLIRARCFDRALAAWMEWEVPVESTDVAEDSWAEGTLEPRSDAEFEEQAEVEVEGTSKEPLITCFRNEAAATTAAESASATRGSGLGSEGENGVVEPEVRSVSSRSQTPKSRQQELQARYQPPRG